MMAKVKFWKGHWIEVDVCCDDLIKESENGTDAEVFGPLLSICSNGSWSFDSVVKNPKFCPWCGTPVKEDSINA